MHKILQKIEEKGILPSSFYKANVTLIQRQKRDYPKKTKAMGHISPEYTHSLSKQILTHRIQPCTSGPSVVGLNI